MSRSAVVALAIVLAATIGLALWKRDRDARLRAQWSAAIRNVIDTTRDNGWLETFDAVRSQPLAEYDPRWRPLFGRLLVDHRLGAVVGDPDGGWERDGGDDYSFRSGEASSGSVEIVVDGWWDGHGSIGAQGSVQPVAPHQLYELTLWRGKLAVIYFIGPTPDRFEILAESSDPPVGKGFYRLAFSMERRASGWLLRGTLQDARRGYRVVAQASAADGRLGDGVQGVGILGGGGARASYITGIAVRHGDKGRLAKVVTPGG